MTLDDAFQLAADEHNKVFAASGWETTPDEQRARFGYVLRAVDRGGGDGMCIGLQSAGLVTFGRYFGMGIYEPILTPLGERVRALLSALIAQGERP